MNKSNQSYIAKKYPSISFIDEPMKKHSTFGVGGKAKVLLLPKEETEIISKPIYRYSWNEFTEFEKEIETSDGLKFKLSNDDLDLPYILFYPSGETTGAKFTFSNNNQKYNFVLTHGGEFLRIDEF